MSLVAFGPVEDGKAVLGNTFRFLNGHFLVKVTGSQTSGKLAIFDTRRFARGGPPLHYHEDEDEWFQVVEGIFDILVGGVEYRLGPGDSILGPARIPHAFTNVTETGRLLLVFSPAGRMEEFFREIGGRKKSV